MGGLKDIFVGMAQVVGNAEDYLSTRINEVANQEQANAATGTGSGDPVTGGGGEGGVGSTNGTGNPSTSDSQNSGLSTTQLLELQYDVQKFSIFNNMATSTMQSVAGAYQSVTGNLNFR